jgi:hypothetical protein
VEASNATSLGLHQVLTCVFHSYSSPLLPFDIAQELDPAAGLLTNKSKQSFAYPSLNDVSFIGSGATASVFRISNKCVKIFRKEEEWESD